jgi:hypothetical protein
MALKFAVLGIDYHSELRNHAPPRKRITVRLYVRSSAEVARPTYAELDEGYPDWPGLSSTHRGRAMNRHREVFVGIDIAKERNAVTVAEGGPPVSDQLPPG